MSVLLRQRKRHEPTGASTRLSARVEPQIVTSVRRSPLGCGEFDVFLLWPLLVGSWLEAPASVVVSFPEDTILEAFSFVFIFFFGHETCVFFFSAGTPRLRYVCKTHPSNEGLA